METWLDALNTSPLPVLLNAQDKALDYFVRRDLLRETAAPPETLWHLPEADRLIKKQQGDGSWKYAGKTDTPRQNYSLLETYRRLRLLVEQYALIRAHPALPKAAAYVFSCQTDEGDTRHPGQSNHALLPRRDSRTVDQSWLCRRSPDFVQFW